MFKYTIIISLLLLSSLAYTQIPNYSYHVKIKGMEDTIIYFGHHYGEKQYVIDTIRTNQNGEAEITGSNLMGGIYLIVMPKIHNKYFEIIVNEPKFSLETDTTDFIGTMKFKNSLENTLFYDDLNFIATERKKAEPIKTQLKDTTLSEIEIAKLKDELKTINEKVESERTTLQLKYPGLFYTKFLKAMEEVKIPEPPLNPDGKIDSAFGYNYIKEHYFDNIDFSDERFLHTNIFMPKIKKYLNDYIVRTPDSINVAIDFIIKKTESDSEVFKYVVVSLLNDYANSKIMCMDAVYVHIVDTYYKTGRAFWIDDVALYKITAQAERYRPNLCNKIAPNMVLQDTSDMDISLASINKKYTVVVFWQTDCSHCKKEMPKLEEIYPEIAARGGEVYAVYSEEEWDKWKKWLKEHPYPWINVGNMKLKSNFQIQYNVDQTPTVYILDSNKKIIAKKIGVEQIIEILDSYEEMLKQ